MLGKSKWEVRVHAGSYYQDLSDRLGGKDISLFAEHDDHTGYVFFMRSPHVDEIDDKEKVGQRLYSLQILLNGAMRVCWKSISHQPVKFDRFALIGDGGGGNVICADTLEDYPFSKNPMIDGFLNSRYGKPERHCVSYLVFYSKRLEAVRMLLFQAGLISTYTLEGKVLTWGTLYKMLDTIKFYSKEINCDVGDFVKNKSDIKRFTGTCNNIAILGVEARHGQMGWDEPKLLMTDINEACHLILEMSYSFIRKYIEARGSA